MMLLGGRPGAPKSFCVVGISCDNASLEAERRRGRPGRNGGPMKRGRRHRRSPHSKARAVACMYGVADLSAAAVPPTPKAGCG